MLSWISLWEVNVAKRSAVKVKPKNVGRKKKLPGAGVRSRATNKDATNKDVTVLSGCLVVGIGASAGGLEAFTQLLQHLSVDTGLAFVLVQHLDPHHESALTHILTRTTSMPVREVSNNLRVVANHIYIIPPNMSMAIEKGVLKLSARDPARFPHHSIDSFFESLALDQREQAIGIVLSGTATDGTLGLEAIKAEGGITFAQDESAKYDSMPRSAIAAGVVDFVLSPQNIAQELARIAKHPYVASASLGAQPKLNSEAEREGNQLGGPDEPLASGGQGTPPTGSRKAKSEAAAKHGREGVNEIGIKQILMLLRNHCGVDFSLYKSSTIQRRVIRRMVLNRHDTYDQYAAFLKGNAKELDALYSDVLISVTSFFRNPEAFDALKAMVFPALLRKRGRDEPVRVWTLGCSTGQEAYSIAMSFAEFSENLPSAPKLQIFATDLNDALLEKARHGLYAKNLEQDISPERLRRFFVEEEGGYRISKSVREQVVFARQNVLSDPPFSRMDLISCRNLLIYLEAGLQKKIMPAFHYALRPGGFLFLGSSETVGQFTELFEPADKRQKIFSKKPAPTPAFRLPLPSERAAHSSPGQRPLSVVENAQGLPEGFRGELDAQREADRAMVNQFAPPGVLVNSDLQVLQFRGPTSAYLEPATGRASFHVLKMAREGLMLPLRAALDKAKRESKPVRREGVQVQQNGKTRTVHLQVIPLKNLKDRSFLILFESADASDGKRPASIARRPKPPAKKEESRRVNILERELSETRDYLQSIQEQNEAAHEELQASSEEVQSANEELQSINEELETSKEELESSNEELVTVNEEMANRNAELNRLNSDLNNLQVSMNTAIVVFSRDLTIRRFTSPAEKIFNLLPTDVGRSLGGVRHNLGVTDLEHLLAEVIDTLSVHTREVQDREGHWYALRARPYMTVDNKIDGVVLLLVDIDTLKRREQEIKSTNDYAQAILRTARDPLVVLRADLRVNTANEAFYKLFELKPKQTEGRSIFELGKGAWDIPKLRQLLTEILPRNSFFNDYEITHDFPGLGSRTILLNARRLDSAGVPDSILLAIEDITERLETQADLSASEGRYRRLFEASRDGILILDPKTRKIAAANPFILELLNYSRTELVGKELFEIGLLKDETESREAFERLKATGFLRYENLPLKTRGGEHREVEVLASLHREDEHTVIQCNIRDITERRQAEDGLRESAERLRFMAESMPQKIFTANPNGEVVYLNQQWMDFTGLSLEQIRDWGWTQFIHLDDLQENLRLWKHSVATGEPFLFEHRFRRADGVYRWHLSRAHAMRGADNNVIMWIGSNTDIEDQKAAEQRLEEAVRKRTLELEESHERLRLADRMISLGTLAAGLGHDMGNLLLPMCMRMDSMEAATDLPERLRKDVTSIRESAGYLQKLTNGLRLLAATPGKAGRGDQYTELTRWCADAATLFRTVLPANVEFKCSVGDVPVAVGLARVQLTQAVFNLVQNAGDALREQAKGRVEVWVRPGPDTATIQIGVTDNGPGMTPEVQRRCLEPFFSTKTRDLSTGLGLALVRGIVENAGGQIAIDPVMGGGTTFTLTLVTVALRNSNVPASSRSAAFISLSDARMSSLAANLTREAGLAPQIVKEPNGDDFDSALWITDSGPDAMARALKFVKDNPARRAVVFNCVVSHPVARDSVARDSVANHSAASHSVTSEPVATPADERILAVGSGPGVALLRQAIQKFYPPPPPPSR